MILLFLFYCAVLSIGLGVLSLLIDRKQLIEFIGFTFGIGIVLVWGLAQLSFVFGIPTQISVLFFLAISFFFLFKLKETIRLHLVGRIKLPSVVLVLLTITNIVFVFIQSAIRPLIAWDGYASWFFGAKALFIDGKIYSQFYHYANYDFPNLFQSFIAFQSVFIGSYNEQLSLIFFPVLYIFLLLIFFSALLKRNGLFIALFFTFLLGSTQEVLRHAGYLDQGYMDIILSYFILGSGILYLEYKENKNFLLLITLQFFLLGAAFIKNEGFIVYALFQSLVFFTFYKSKAFNKRKYLLYSFLTTIPVAVWILFKTYYLPANIRFQGQLFMYANQMLPSFSYMLKEFLDIQRWGFMWVLIILFTPLIMRNKKLVGLFTFSVVLLIVYVVIYFASPIDPKVHILGSFDRLILHVYPLLLLLSALSINDYAKYKKMIRL